MKKHLRSIWMITAMLLCFIAAPLIADGDHGVYAADRTVINSFQDFFEAFSQQIHDRETLVYYDVPDKGLAKDLVYQDLSEYGRHYDPENPLLSGCYLVYYVKTVYFTYDANGLKVLIEFPYNGGEMDAHFQEMDRLALQMKKESDYETVKSVHDYLIDNFEYDHSSDIVNHTDIDGFRDKVMVCSGYSLATYYLLNKLGIDTRIITGYGGDGGEQTENHMWNLVKLDGKWYNLDVTWDDLGGSNKTDKYFLKNDADFPQHVRLGVYASPEITAEIAEESWPIPFGTRAWNFLQKNWYIITILLAVIIYIVVNYVRRMRTPASEDNPVPVEYIPDWTERMGQQENMNPYGYNGASGNANPYGNNGATGNVNPYGYSGPAEDTDPYSMYQPYRDPRTNAADRNADSDHNEINR